MGCVCLGFGFCQFSADVENLFLHLFMAILVDDPPSVSVRKVRFNEDVLGLWRVDGVLVLIFYCTFCNLFQRNGCFSTQAK